MPKGIMRLVPDVSLSAEIWGWRQSIVFCVKCRLFSRPQRGGNYHHPTVKAR